MQLTQFEWERYASKKIDDGYQILTYRKRVPGGWLVFVITDEYSGLTFCPDTEHQWIIESPDKVEV